MFFIFNSRISFHWGRGGCERVGTCTAALSKVEGKGHCGSFAVLQQINIYKGTNNDHRPVKNENTASWIVSFAISSSMWSPSVQSGVLGSARPWPGAPLCPHSGLLGVLATAPSPQLSHRWSVRKPRTLCWVLALHRVQSGRAGPAHCSSRSVSWLFTWLISPHKLSNQLA